MVDFAQIYPDKRGGSFSPEPQLWEVRTTDLYDAATPYASGSAVERTPLPITGMYVNRVERECTLYIGSGRRYKIAVLNPGMRMSIAMPSNVNEYELVWTGTNSPSNIAYDATLQPSCEIWTSSQQIFYSESFNPGPRFASLYQPLQHSANPALIVYEEMPYSATSVLSFPMLTSSQQGSDPSYYAQGNQMGPSVFAEIVAAQGLYSKYRAVDLTLNPGMMRSNASYSYAIPFRRAATPRQWSVALLAAATRDVATLYLPAGSTRYMRLHRIEVQILSASAATDIEVVLVQTSTIPTGGTSAASQQLARSWTGAAGSTSTAQTLGRLTPTGGSTYGNIYSGFAMSVGITGAASVINPPPIAQMMSLYEDSFPDSVSPLELTADSGLCVRIESTNAATITGYCRAIFTEYDAL